MTDEHAAAVAWRAWRVTLTGTVVSSLGTGLTLPFLIVFLHTVLGASLPLAGAVVAAGAVVGMAAGTMGGPLGDRVGLGRMLVIGLLAQAGGTALLASAAGLPLAVAGVMLSGGGNALAWPALNGLVAQQVPPAAQPRAYALRFGVMNAGIGIGGLASGWIVALDDPGSFQLVYGVDAATTVVFALLAVLGMRGAPGFRPDRAALERPLGAVAGGYRAVLADRGFVAFLACSLVLGVFGYAQLDGPWAANAALVIGTTPQVIGIAFAANTAAIVVAQLGVVRLSSRWRRSRLLVCTCALWTVAWVVTGLAGLPALRGPASAVLLVVSLAVFGLGETFLSPVQGALPNALAPDHLRARYNALASTTFPLGNLVGPLLGGALLGSAVPASWVLVLLVGTALAAAAALGLARVLPAAVDRPALAAA